MRKLIRLFLSLALLMAGPAAAHPAIWNRPQAYLALTPPSDTPEPFAAGRLAEPGMFAMGRVAFSRDGREFYYTEGNSWNSLADARIRVIRFDGRRWAAPMTVNEQFVSPTLSMDDDTLYFRRGNMHNVWRSHRVPGGWSAPEVFLDKTVGLYDFMPTLSGAAYIGSDPSPDDVKRGTTLAFSVLHVSKGDIEIESLGTPLNAPGFNGDLFVAPDESYIIISTRETPTFESELYISFRRPDRTWTVPVSLGAKVNDGLAHRWGSTSRPTGNICSIPAEPARKTAPSIGCASTLF